MKRTRDIVGVLLAACVLAASFGCAGGGTSTTTPTERQRSNAEKQQELQQMLEMGQRN